jgi:hypothetical protein
LPRVTRATAATATTPFHMILRHSRAILRWCGLLCLIRETMELADLSSAHIFSPQLAAS